MIQHKLITCLVDRGLLLLIAMVTEIALTLPIQTGEFNYHPPWIRMEMAKGMI